MAMWRGYRRYPYPDRLATREKISTQTDWEEDEERSEGEALTISLLFSQHRKAPCAYDRFLYMSTCWVAPTSQSSVEEEAVSRGAAETSFVTAFPIVSVEDTRK